MIVDISIVIDSRREKKDNTYPVKLRVYSSILGKAKMYSTGLDMSLNKFGCVWETDNPKKIYHNERNYLDEFRVKAIEAAKNTEPFSFELFEKKLKRRSGDGKNVVYHYNQRINYLKDLQRFGTADVYELSLKSIMGFINEGKKTEVKSIPFNTITPFFLQKYENYMIGLGRSETTVKMYLEALRAIFNFAIAENEISSDLYPFGKNKYEIPAANAIKKALTKSQLKILFNAIPKTPEQKKAKDFWFFSFICNGMNIKDIALLKYENIKGDTLEFKRAKTRQTSKKRLRTIVVPLIGFSKDIIEKYGNEDKSPQNYIFSILDDNTAPEDMKPRIKNFTRFINQHMKLIAKANGITIDISTYWARHSFATLAIQGGANMEFVQEAFGHQNLSTTQNYFAGFEDETRKNIVENLLNFDN